MWFYKVLAVALVVNVSRLLWVFFVRAPREDWKIVDGAISDAIDRMRLKQSNRVRNEVLRSLGYIVSDDSIARPVVTMDRFEQVEAERGARG